MAGQYLTDGVVFPVSQLCSVSTETDKKATALLCVSPRSIRALLMCSPRVKDRKALFS